MSTLLIKNASFVATMDKNENELRDVSIFCENGVIREVGAVSYTHLRAHET